MSKKVIKTGSPKYMALYTSLMTILLAFFILLTTMSEDQDSGFNAGIGDVKDSFGVTGGLGLFQFFHAGKRGRNPFSVDREIKDVDTTSGIHEDLIKSDTGGSGNTDLSSQPSSSGRYLRLPIYGAFAENSSRVPEDMQVFLGRVGMGMATMLDQPISIRCYAEEFPDEGMNATLAAKRAVNIMRFLNRNSDMPFSRMTATGYASRRYFGAATEAEAAELPPGQGNYFYMFFSGD